MKKNQNKNKAGAIVLSNDITLVAPLRGPRLHFLYMGMARDVDG